MPIIDDVLCIDFAVEFFNEALSQPQIRFKFCSRMSPRLLPSLAVLKLVEIGLNGQK